MNRCHAPGFGMLAMALLLLALAVSARAADTVVYYHTDALRSVAVVTNAQGQVLERTHYAPYGQVLDRPLRDGPGYTGHLEDATTGLVYMQQRYYDPESGRFLSADPVGVDPTSGQNFNRYWYANNNPIRYVDPDGRDCKSASGTTTCQIMVTGSHIPKSISFATPSGLSGTQKSSAASEHLYDIRTPNGGKSDQAVQRSIGNNSTPGSNDKPATPGGTLNYATPSGGRGVIAKISAFLSFGHDDPRSPVKSYSFTAKDGNIWAINVTEPTHGFHFGYVLRGSVGGQTMSIGEGWAWKQKTPILGNYADQVWQAQNQKNINEAH